MLKFKIILALIIYLIVTPIIATTLFSIHVVNGINKSTVTLGFDKNPVYNFFLLHNPERIIVDIYQSSPVHGLPLDFNNKNMIKRIRVSTPVDKQSIRLVFDLTNTPYAQTVTEQNGKFYNITFTVINKKQTSTSSIGTSLSSRPIKNSFTDLGTIMKSSQTTSTISPHKWFPIKRGSKPIVVAIDAGHGGQDPGATSPNGLYEKNITIAIARKLKTVLDADPIFKPELTRNGDYFISVIGRSDVARKKGASVLVSIHADAALNRNARGASVWVLSKRRANSEMANWLEQHEKQSELLGGAGIVLAHNYTDPYFSQAVLDLQFDHSRRVGYDIATKVLNQLQQVCVLHKNQPKRASLGVLGSPDIPSLLVEIGFISNTQEERLLSNNIYQEKIAKALHRGLRDYFLSPLTTNYYTVQYGDTLSGIAHKYSVSIEILRSLNQLKNDNILVGQWLWIPVNNSVASSYRSALTQRNTR